MFDMKNSQYFQSLPKVIKNSVWESGLIFETEEDLQKYVKNLNE